MQGEIPLARLKQPTKFWRITFSGIFIRIKTQYQVFTNPNSKNVKILNYKLQNKAGKIHEDHILIPPHNARGKLRPNVCVPKKILTITGLTDFEFTGGGRHLQMQTCKLKSN